MFRLTKLALATTTAVLFTAAVAGGAPPVQAAQQRVCAGEVTQHAVFNDPRSPAPSRAISNELRHLIDCADPGSFIKIAIYQFADSSIMNSLVAAHNQGVNVQVVADGFVQSVGDAATTWAALKAGFAAKPGPDSWARTCPSQVPATAGEACIGNGDKMHNKFVLLTSLKGAKYRNVVFQSSANFNEKGSGDGMWNNAVTIVGNGPLHAQYNGYFADLANQRKNDDYYSSRRPPATFGAFRPYYFPTATGDPVPTILAAAQPSCKNKAEVRVAMALFTRRAVALELVNLAKAGCTVQVIYGTATPDVLAHLRHPKVESYQSSRLHSKYLAIDYKNGDKFVWTGSHNYSYPALRSNDEVMLRIHDTSIHNDFETNFRTLLGAGAVKTRP